MTRATRIDAMRRRCDRAVAIDRAARNPHLGQRPRLVGERDLAGEVTIERVVGQLQIAGREIDAVDCRRAAVAARHRRGAGDAVAVAQVGGRDRLVQRDARDALVGQREQLAGLADAVAIGVLPELHLGEGAVRGVKDVVAVLVKRAQGLEAGLGIADLLVGRAVGVVMSAAELGVDAKELAAGVDRAIAVEITNEPGIVAIKPAGAGANAVGVVIEEDRGSAVGRDAEGFDAVAIEVDGKGVAGRAPINCGPPV